MNFICDLDNLVVATSYSYADYLTWKFYDRIELNNGKLEVLKNIRTLHQTVFGILLLILDKYFRTKNLLLIQAPFAVSIFNKSKYIA